MQTEYDPLDYGNLAKSVVRALFERDPEQLPPTDRFDGSGVYALYYNGGFAAYSPIASPDCRIPIYVGKAIPAGGRKGKAKRKSSSNSGLTKRLSEHAKSIDAANNLDLADFRCRYLLVKPVWITLAERFLIDVFNPVWNVVVDGFGNHAVGKGRKPMKRPKWDTIHPGREWASELKQAYDADEILGDIRRVLEQPLDTHGELFPDVDGD